MAAATSNLEGTEAVSGGAVLCLSGIGEFGGGVEETGDETDEHSDRLDPVPIDLLVR